MTASKLFAPVILSAFALTAFGAEPAKKPEAAKPAASAPVKKAEPAKPAAKPDAQLGKDAKPAPAAAPAPAAPVKK